MQLLLRDVIHCNYSFAIHNLLAKVARLKYTQNRLKVWYIPVETNAMPLYINLLQSNSFIKGVYHLASYLYYVSAAL